MTHRMTTIRIAILCLIGLTLSASAAPLDDAYSAFQAGELDAADAILSQLLRETPRDADVHFLYGQVALARGKTSHAAFAFERVLDLNPANQRARLELARTYYLLGQYEAAQTEFQTVLTENPPPAVQSRINAFLKAIRKQNRNWAVSGHIALAAFHDDNVNYGPADAEVDTRLGRLLVNEAARPASAWGIALSGHAQLVVDPGLRDAWQWSTTGSGYRSWLEDRNSQAIGYAQLQTGLQHIGLRHIARLYGATDRLRYGGNNLVGDKTLLF